jgi:hypothetical protein
MQSPRKTWVVAGVACLIVLSLCGLGGWAVLQVADFPQAARQLPAAEREYRAMGLPWTASDLARKPAVSDSDNAAILIREVAASGTLRKLSREHDEIEDLLREGRLADATERMQPYREIVPRIVEAARRPDADFKRDWDLGPILLLPEYAEIKNMVRLLGLEGRLKAQRGDAEGAASRLLDARRLGAHAGREPILIAHLVYIACDAIALRALEDALAAHRGNRAGLARLRSVAEADLPAPQFRNALRGEMYMGLAGIRNLNYRQIHRLASGKGDAETMMEPASLRRDGVPRGFMERAFLARHLQMWSEAERRMARRPDDVRAQSLAVQEVSDGLEGERRLSYLVSAVLFPVFSQAGEAYVQREAREHAVRAAARVLEFEARNGRFPERLEEVGPVPLDPFDGEPLRYRRTEEGFRVYSVGRNMRDQGGMTPSEVRGDFDARAGDLVVGFPPTPTGSRPRQ